jgi:hypothetical protein
MIMITITSTTIKKNKEEILFDHGRLKAYPFFFFRNRILRVF